MPGVPETMRAHRLLAWERPPELVEVPVPEPGPGQVVVRVAGCGLRHSDLEMMAMPQAVGEALAQIFLDGAAARDLSQFDPARPGLMQPAA